MAKSNKEKMAEFKNSIKVDLPDKTEKQSQFNNNNSNSDGNEDGNVDRQRSLENGRGNER